ncbi:MAG TPA: DMT family transporter [Acidimicrobiales bacterium]|nr:DMT family transporter [Acidimicrobiales bacterium]
MVYLLALGASVANALTSILQRMGVQDAPDDVRLRLRLMGHALRRRIWIVGFLLMVLSFVMQASALHFGRLTQVQPILTTELLFLVLILGTRFRFHIGPREWLGVLAASAGLAGFLIFASPTGGNVVPNTDGWLEVGLSCGAVAGIAVLLALRGPRWWRAAMFGVAAAVGFAFTASLTKVVSDYAFHDWASIVRHWETYALAGCGMLSVFLAQNAFHAGPIAASQGTLVMVDPLASILIGVELFGDQLRTSGAWGPLEALSLLTLFAGAYSLCRSPLVRGVKGEDHRERDLLAYQPRNAASRPPTPAVPPSA